MADTDRRTSIFPLSPTDDEDMDFFPLETMTLPPDLEHAMAGIFSSNNPLDTSEFDPVAYINLVFPNEQSLASVDKVLSQLHQKMRRMDMEIRELIRIQTDAGRNTLAELEEAKRAIEELFKRVQTIREKATNAELMVKDITKDITSLDHAKKNLTVSMTLLRRLQMLVMAIQQLRLFVQRKQYKDIALLLSAISSLSTHLQPFKTIRKVVELFDQIHFIQMDLKRQIFAEFDAGFNMQGGLRGSAQTLNEACLIAEALDSQMNVKSALQHWYTELQLRDYRNMFRNSQDFSGLDQVTRRYGWLKQTMKTYDEEHCQIFPLSWNMGERLCEKFCEDTRRDLDTTLKDLGAGVDVKLMLQALQLTLEFEAKLEKRFKTISTDDTFSPGGTIVAAPNSKFYRVISSVFEPYLSHYITSEDRNLASLMETYRTKQPIADFDENSFVINSSTDLFYTYRQNLVQFSRFSTGKPFLEFCQLLGKWLVNYSELLIQQCPKDDKRVLTSDELKTLCLIINTADYCYRTTGQLEDKLKEKIEPTLKEQVSITNQRESFFSVTATGIKYLLKSLENAVEPGFSGMTKVPWGTLSAVGDQSEYVTQIGTAVLNCMETVKKTLRTEQNKYFRSFCDKSVEMILARFQAGMAKCKPISEIGAEQMLLDLHALRTVLLQMATTEESPTAPSIYVKLVSKQIQKVERVLKMVLTPSEPTEGFVANYQLMFSDDLSVITFQKVLDLKGLKRADYSALMETFNAKTGASASLIPPASTAVNASSSSSFVPTKLNANLNMNIPKMAIPKMSMPITTETLTDALKVDGEKLKKMMGGLNFKKGTNPS